MSVAVQHAPSLFQHNQPQFQQHHRRSPSTPVKPTPGLIFLTRPLQSQKQQQQQQAPMTPPRSSRPRGRKQQDRSSPYSSASSGNEDGQGDVSRTPENKDKTRSARKPTEATTTPVTTPATGRKPKTIVPPPKSSSPKLSQAEAFNSSNAHIILDPTVLHTQPSGRIARQRRSQPHKASNSVSGPNFPTPTAPVPLPTSRRRAASPSPLSNNLSKSEPLTSNMRPRTAPRRRTTPQKALPLPDWDMPATLGLEDTPPPSPTESSSSNELTWQQALLASGPRTAPIDGALPPVTPPRAPRRPTKHIRSPSYPVEALFNMSLEDESPSQAPIASLSFNARRGVAPVDRFAYAGPTFHNSPIASALPAPKFLD